MSLFALGQFSYGMIVVWRSMRVGLIRHLGITEVAAIEKEKAMETYTENEKTIGLRSPVKNKISGEYLGKVTAMRNVWYVKTDGTGSREFDLEHLELAPRLTPEEAWMQLPLDIVRDLVEFERTSITGTLYPSAYRELRHRAYVLLGGAGIKVTDDVKERVRSIIETLAGHLGMGIYV